jgi:hypothetical protein
MTQQTRQRREVKKKAESCYELCGVFFFIERSVRLRCDAAATGRRREDGEKRGEESR